MEKELEKVSGSGLYLSIEELIQKLMDIQIEYSKKGYTNIRCEMKTEYGYYDDRWEVLVIYGTEPKKPKKTLTVVEIINSDKVCFNMD